MEYRLLGDFEVSDRDGAPIALTTRQRMMLAVLLYRINTVVARPDLIRLVWGPQPDEWPPTAERLVTDYVSRLRTVVGRPGSPSALRLVARPPGFVAVGDATVVDWHRFRTLVADARIASEDGATRTCRQLLQAALQLWRGPALADLPADSLRPMRARMTDLRLLAARQLAASALVSGDPAVVVECLDELCTAHPEQEMLAALFVTALHRIGRRDAAIAAYRRSRDYLAEELGLDPSSQLEYAYRALLAVPAIGA